MSALHLSRCSPPPPPHRGASIVVLILVAATLGAAVSKAAAQGGPSPVVVMPLVQREVMSGQPFVGTVKPLQVAVIGSAVAGRVVEYPVKAGDRVAAGDTLAQLLTATIKLELVAATKTLKQYQAELEELRSGPRPEELDRLSAEVEALKAQNKYLVEKAKRLADVRTAVAKEEYELAVSDAAVSAGRLRAAAAAHAMAIAGTRKERIAQAEAQVAAQRAKVHQLRDKIRKYTIITRFDGYVTSELTEVGEWLQVGTPVAEVSALDTVKVVAQVVENQVRFVRPQTQVRVEIPALPNVVLEPGVVERVIPKGDERARTFPVVVRMKNVIRDNFPLVKAGMYARVVLPTGAPTNALLTSKDAIVLGGESPLVYIASKADDGLVAQPVPVRLGVAVGNLLQIIESPQNAPMLQPGAQVIVQGNERLRPGSPVVVKEVQEPPADSDAARSTKQ